MQLESDEATTAQESFMVAGVRVVLVGGDGASSCGDAQRQSWEAATTKHQHRASGFAAVAPPCSSASTFRLMLSTNLPDSLSPIFSSTAFRLSLATPECASITSPRLHVVHRRPDTVVTLALSPRWRHVQDTTAQAEFLSFQQSSLLAHSAVRSA